MNMVVFWGILIPFIGTSLGAACVFIMKRDFHPNVQKGLTGFAAGVMVAASIWSLLIPAMEESAHLGKVAFLPPLWDFGWEPCFYWHWIRLSHTCIRIQIRLKECPVLFKGLR